MNRFDLEEKITEIHVATDHVVDTLIYMIGDSKTRPTEDDLLNVLIGLKTNQNFRHDQLMDMLEQLIKDGVLTNKNCEPCN